MGKLTLTIASSVERDIIAAELWYGDTLWAEIHEEDGEFIIVTISPDNQSQCFKLEEVEQLFQIARQRLGTE